MSTIISNPDTEILGFPIFLTAYDPSDLPGGSMDPLGFERGYLFLADKILPGLTNVANQPRYFAVLCAGASLAEVALADPPKVQYQRRLDCLLRFERFWALANILTSAQGEEESLPTAGIRGVRYAKDRAASVLRQEIKDVDANFPLLSRQVPYGAVGIYGAVADGMRFLDRKTFSLTPDLGERLADGFLKDSETPRSLIKAVREDCSVPLKKLIEWGQSAHIAGTIFPLEADCLSEALHRDPVRSSMTEVLRQNPFVGKDDTELKRLARILPELKEDPMNRDLAEAVSAILAYEECYRIAQLGFERLLWLCRNLPAAAIAAGDLVSDEVLSLARDRLPLATKRLIQVLDSAQTELFRMELQRLDDTRNFLERLSAACGTSADFAHELMARHEDVQRGKFDRGRRKMPWLEMSGQHITLTMTRVGGLNHEATLPTDITPHPYRLSSADALNHATEVQ